MTLPIGHTDDDHLLPFVVTYMVILVVTIMLIFMMFAISNMKNAAPSDCEVGDVLLLGEDEEWYCVSATALIETGGDF